MKPVTRNCQHCGKEFSASFQWKARKYEIYCGRGCYVATLKFSDEKAPEVMWSKIDRNGPNGCWIYTGKANIRDYGTMVWRNDRKLLVHRFLYQLAHGNLAGSHVFCLHKCDTPRCVNPAHIFLGDDAANTADKVAKGRHLYGERAGRARLTDKLVLEIRARVRAGKDGKTFEELAAEYGVSEATLYHAATGHTWRHLPGAAPKPRVADSTVKGE